MVVSSKQTAYVKDRFIDESGWLISGIIEIADSNNLEGVTKIFDIEKAIDFSGHTLLIQALKKHVFGKKFIS